MPRTSGVSAGLQTKTPARMTLTLPPTKGTAMSTSSTSIRLRRCTTAIAGLLASLVAICAAAPAAFAMRVTPEDSGAGPVVHSGTPTWEIALIAVGVGVAFGLVSMAAVAVVRGRSTARAQRALS
jgi:hypothetical protein